MITLTDIQEDRIILHITPGTEDTLSSRKKLADVLGIDEQDIKFEEDTEGINVKSFIPEPSRQGAADRFKRAVQELLTKQSSSAPGPTGPTNQS